MCSSRSTSTAWTTSWLCRGVQRHPLKGSIEHVDLLLVRQGEKVVVEVQIVLVGEPAAETLVNLENPTVAVEAEATHLPERIEVSIEGAEAGTQVHASDLVLPPEFRWTRMRTCSSSTSAWRPPRKSWRPRRW